jgi:hypothetical protein
MFMKADGENHDQFRRNKNSSSLFLIVKGEKGYSDNWGIILAHRFEQLNIVIVDELSRGDMILSVSYRTDTGKFWFGSKKYFNEIDEPSSLLDWSHYFRLTWGTDANIQMNERKVDITRLKSMRQLDGLDLETN